MKHSDMTFARIEEVTADGVSARLSPEPDDVSGYMMAAGGGATVGGKCIVVQTPHGSSYIIPVSSTPGGGGAGLSIKSVVPTMAALHALTGAKNGDTHLVSGTGDLYVFSGGSWHDLGHIVGPAGTQGSAGTAGSDGAIGPTGPDGARGHVGPAGHAGVAGADGATGGTGPAGHVGTAGPPGSKGDPGVAGHVGSAGPQGQQGIRGQGLRLEAAVATKTDLPASGGAPGAVHYVTDEGVLYIWGETTSGGNDHQWHAIGHIEGAQGVDGPQGPTGAAGVTGHDGAEGHVGATGPAGHVGDRGAKGLQGVEGPAGHAGSDGAAGPKGTGISFWGPGSWAQIAPNGSQSASNINMWTLSAADSGAPHFGGRAARAGDLIYIPAGTGYREANNGGPMQGHSIKVTKQSWAPSSPATGDIWIST